MRNVFPHYGCNGKYSYIDEVTHESCQRMHSYGIFELSGTYITGLKSNQITTRPVILAGHIDTDETCYGGVYSDPELGETLLCWAVSELHYKITLPMFG